MKKKNLILALYIFVSSIQSINMQFDIDILEQTFIQAASADCVFVRKMLGITYENAANIAKCKMSGVFLNLLTDTDMIPYSLPVANKSIIQSPHFKKNLPTVIVVHGYLEDSDTISITKELAREIKCLGIANVLSFDHSCLTRGNYFYSSLYTQFVGEALGRVLAEMYAANVTGNFHLIGLSLGCHVCGHVGKEYFKASGVKIDRISGLDPAGPCFFKVPPEQRLCNTDANFVDVIHTDMGTLGTTIVTGHVDFFPNGGKCMPGCCNKICGHIRSLCYFKESLKNKDGFLAVNCADLDTFNKCQHKTNPKACMGFWLNKNDVLPGTYYLNTTCKPLYGLGIAGI